MLEEENLGFVNADGNRVTLILVGTKSDKLFEGGVPQEEENLVIDEETNQETDAAEAKLLTMPNQPAQSDSKNPLAETVGKALAASSVYHLTPLLKNKDIDKVAQHFVDNNGFEAYWKTSALFGTNVKNVFDQAIFSTYENRLSKKSSYEDEVDEMGPDKKATGTYEDIDRKRSSKMKVKGKDKEKCNIQ